MFAAQLCIAQQNIKDFRMLSEPQKLQRFQNYEIKITENTSLAAPGALANRLQLRTACNAAPPASGPQNGRRGLPLGFGALPSTFAK